MFQRTLTLMILVLATFASAACAQVVATHAVWGELASVVGGDEITVITIIPSGFCPSHYDLRPSDIAAIASAQLILYSGIEPWLDTLLASLNPGATAAALPGIWNTPDAAAEKLEQIYALLAELDPAHQPLFRDRTDAYLAQLTALRDELQTAAVAHEIAGIPVVCMQWQAAYVAWLGFDVAATYAPPTDLSLRDLVDLTAAGQTAGAVAVIDNLQSGIDFGAKLAREIGAVHVVFSNFPGSMPFTSTLLELLRRNAESLFTAVKPSQGEIHEN